MVGCFIRFVILLVLLIFEALDTKRNKSTHSSLNTAPISLKRVQPIARVKVQQLAV